MPVKSPEHIERVRYSCRNLARLLHELRGYILPEKTETQHYDPDTMTLTSQEKHEVH